jgi:hypothetical protein
MLPVVGAGVGGGRLSPQPLVHAPRSVSGHISSSSSGSGVPMVGHRRSIVLGSAPHGKKQD